MDNRLPAGLRGRVIFGKGNKVTIGDRIRRIRKKRRLTQAELAMMSGLSLSAIQGYEQGRYEPKRKSLESIAEVFKIPVDELYDMPVQLSTNLASLGTDCISRQAAIDVIRDMQAFEDDNGQPYLYLYDVMAVFTDEEELPTIQPEPKRGKWNRLDMDTFNCNKCGATFVLNQGGEKMHFCPNCGAEMEVTE